MLNRIYIFNTIAIGFLSVLILVSACTTTEPVVNANERDHDQDSVRIVATEENLSQGRSYFIRGITAMELGDLEAAEVLLTRAEASLPQSSGVYFALAELYLEMEDYTTGILYGEKAVELDPDNKWFRFLLVDGYQASGNNTEVMNQLEELHERLPSDLEVLYMKAQVQAQMGEYARSNKTYERILNLTGPDRSIHYQRISNFTRLEETDAIIEELKKVLKLDPGNINTLLMLNQFYIEQGQIDDAHEVLKKAQERNPRHPEALVNHADIHINREEWEIAGRLLQDLVGDTLVSSGNKLEIVQYIISRFSNDPGNESLRQTTASLINTLLDTEPGNGLAHAMAAEFYLKSDNGDQSLYHLRKTVELMPENDAAWRQLIQSYYVEGYYEKAIASGKKANQHVPEDAFIQFFMGGSYFLLEKYDEAIMWLKAASELPSRSAFRSIIFGTLGDTFASLDRWKDADDAYEEAITLDFDNDVALNNYAYYLSEREERLDQAKNMAKRALELNPDNSAYLDTMGWIYYKMGDYESAHKYINASIETGDASAEVMEHMGDVYDQLGEPDRALYWWQKSLGEDKTRTHLKERLHIN